MGFLNKSFKDIKKDFANGLGFENSLFKTSISKTDFQALKNFNSAIKVTNDGLTKSQRISKAWNDNMTGCSMAAKRMGNDLVTGKKKISDISSAMNATSASTKALGTAMNIFANVGIILTITAITKVVSELTQAQDNAVQATKEATESYKNEISSISDYKEKISELQTELNSENLSYEETKKKHTELMAIQDELIQKFGSEKSSIESITAAINGQIDALDELNEKSYRDWLAKADYQTDWNKLLTGGQSGLDQAIKYMETEKTVSFLDMRNANLSEELQEIQTEIDKAIQSKYNLEKSFAMFKIIGTPDEIKKQLEAIRQDYIDLSNELFSKYQISGNWNEYREEAINSIDEIINKLDEGLSKHQETYQIYIEGMIKYDSEYSDEYATILQKRAELESAQISGNREAIQEAKRAFMQAINQGIEASGSNENIKKYFESLYPELQAEFSDWKFEIALDTNANNLATISKELGEKYTSTDLIEMINDDSIKIADSTFNLLIDKAIEYGICTNKSTEEIQKLIDLLVKLNIIQSSTLDEEVSLFSSFDDTSLWERIQLITSQFEEGTLSHKDYFDALQSEIDNFDASNFTDSIEDANHAAQQFFTDSVQQTAHGFSELIHSFDNGEMSISEYLEGYLSIGETLSTLTDKLQENSATWNQNGEAITASQNLALDNVQNNLFHTMTVITSYQDSIYSLEQIMIGAVQEGSDEFAAHANVIAQDLALIVQKGGLMADTIANTLGTTTTEIAQNLTDNVSNQSLAAQAIAANTNLAITDMATSIGELFDELGKAISQFKVDISFKVQKFDIKEVLTSLLKNEEIPEIKFSLQASGESLTTIGDAISSFGESLVSNFIPQTIDLEDFYLGSTENNKNYTPSSSILKNYQDALNQLQNTSQAASDATESATDAATSAANSVASATSDSARSVSDTVTSAAAAASDSAQSASETAEDATQDIKSYISDYMEYMKQSLNTGKLSYQDYCSAVSAFLSQMYQESKITATDYYSYTEEMHQEQLNFYDHALSAINTFFDQKIEEEQQAIELLEQENEALEAQMNLMEKASSAVSDYYQQLADDAKAQAEILETENAQYEEKINQMESALNAVDAYYDSLIEKEEQNLENLETEKEKIQDKLDTMDSVINTVTEYYDSLIEAEQESLDAIEQENASLEEKISLMDSAVNALTDYYNSLIEKEQESITAKEEENAALQEQLEKTDSALSAVGKYYDSLIEKEQESITAIEEQNEALQEQLSKMDSAISAVTAYYDTLIEKEQESITALEEQNQGIQEQIDNYSKILASVDRVYQTEIDGLTAQQNAIQEKIDLLQEENSELDFQYRKEQAIYELERSQTQKTKKVLTENGFVYTVDQDAVKENQKNLKDIQNEELISNLEKEKEVLQENINSLEEYRSKWQDISNVWGQMEEDQLAKEMFGENYAEVILQNRQQDIDTFQNQLISANQQLENNLAEIDSINEVIEEYNEQKDHFSSLSSVVQSKKDKQNAAEIFGADWQTLLEEGKLNDFEGYENQYLSIQSEIDNNQKVIDSFNEKIEQYNQQKEQFSSLTSVIQEETEKQNAAELFGANWQTLINEGKLNDWEAYKNRYLSIQEQINDNEQFIDSINERIAYYQKESEAWQATTSTLQEQSKEESAIQLFGENWREKLENGELDVSLYKGDYLSLQSQMDKNNQLAEAINQQIDQYHSDKESWSSITDTLQKEIDQQNAIDFLGADWKDRIQNGTFQDLESFTEKYLNSQHSLDDTEDAISLIEKQIEKYNRDKEELDSFTNAFQEEKDNKNALVFFGPDWKQQVQEGDLKALNAVSQYYNYSQKVIENNENLIDSYNQTAESFEELAEKWGSLSDIYNDTVNNQAAEQFFGADWLTKLQDGTLNFEDLSNQYLQSKNEVSLNQQKIDSQNAQIDSLEDLKEQWNEVTNVYEDSINAQCAAQLLGADWENTILNDRTETLTTFKNNYIAIQQAIADSAQKSAEEQMKASQKAASVETTATDSIVQAKTSSNTDNVVTSAPSQDNSSSSSKGQTTNSELSNISEEQPLDKDKEAFRQHTEEEKKLTEERINANKQLIDKDKEAFRQHAEEEKKLVEERNNADKQLIDKDKEAFKKQTEEEKKAAEERKLQSQSNQSVNKISGYANKMSKGGVVSEKTSNNTLNKLAKQAGEDVTIFAQNGERVLTPVQNEMWEKWTQALPNLINLSDAIKVNTPEYSTVNLVTKTAQPLQVSIGDIHLHEVQNVDSLSKAIEREFPNKMLQAINKRN